MSTRVTHQAQAAVEGGDVALARRLLQQAVREDPQDFMAWLWLAYLAPSHEAALSYLQRAEMLAPDDPAVAQMRTRLRPEPESGPVPVAASHISTPRPSRVRSRIGWSALLVLLVLFVVFIAGALGFAAAAPSGGLPPLGEMVAGLTSGGDPLEPMLAALEPTPVPTVTTEPTAVGAPTPTLAPTLTPSPTPEPTPTGIPTFVSPLGASDNPSLPVAPGERWIDVNLTTQVLTAYEGDTAVFSTYISSGTWEFPTVTGQFRTYMKYESQTMNGYLLGYDYYIPDVPYVMYFYEDYAIHGAYWHNSFGTPMSHGCVNASPGDAAWLYNWAPIGTLVNVRY